MTNEKSFRKVGSLTWSLAALVVGAGAVAVLAGLWPRLTHGHGWQIVVPAGLVALSALLGFVWQSRAQAARRRQDALDVYATRELARQGETPGHLVG